MSIYFTDLGTCKYDILYIFLFKFYLFDNTSIILKSKFPKEYIYII